MDKATTGYIRQHGLTIPQRNAIDLLVTGRNDGETAALVGVNRVTITKWRLYDPWFRAELNRRRQDLWGAAAARLQALLPKALDAIERELEQGEDPFRVTAQVVRLAGLDRMGVPCGPLDAEEIIGDLVQAKLAQRESERNKYQSATDLLVELGMGSESRKQRDREEAESALQEVRDGIEHRLENRGPDSAD